MFIGGMYGAQDRTPESRVKSFYSRAVPKNLRRLQNSPMCESTDLLLAPDPTYLKTCGSTSR